jgi:hypothetical protein
MIITVYFVRTTEKASRRQLVDYLESEGFVCEEDEATGRAKVLNSRFPLRINETEMTYSMLHNVTCAAAAAASGILISEEEFYELYNEVR